MNEYYGILPPSRRPEAAGKLGLDFQFIYIRPGVDLGVIFISTDLIDLMVRNMETLSFSRDSCRIKKYSRIINFGVLNRNLNMICYLY